MVMKQNVRSSFIIMVMMLEHVFNLSTVYSPSWGRQRMQHICQASLRMISEIKRVLLEMVPS